MHGSTLKKARWFNAQYLKQKSDAELAALFRPVLNEKGIEASDGKVEQVMGLMKERATFVSELWELTSFLFVAPDDYDPKAAASSGKATTRPASGGLRDLLATVTDFGKENTEKERNGMDRGKRISDRTGDECVPARNHRQKYRTQHVRSV